MTIRPILLSLCSLFALTQSAPAQTTTPAQFPSAAPVVTVTVTPAGVRFVALGPVSQTRLEVYDAAGAPVSDTGFRPGNVRDFSPRAAGLADGSYSCVLTARGLDGRISLRQGSVRVSGGEAALELGGASEGGIAPPEASSGHVGAGDGAATLATHDGRDGSVTATTGALTLRTGDLLAGAEQEHVRVTPDGRVGVGTKVPEATLDVAGTVRAQGGFRFSDGSTLNSAGGRLRLTNAEGEETPSPSAAGTGTLGRLAKWLETGGAGNLGDSVITETAAGNIGVSNPNPTSKLSVLGAPGAELRFDKGAQNITPVLNVISQPASTTLGGAAGLAAGGGGTSFNFSDNLPFFIVKDTKANVVNNNLGFGTPLFTVQPNGNVGVGTTNPASKFHVAGRSLVTGVGFAELPEAARFDIFNPTANIVFSQFVNDSGRWFFMTSPILAGGGQIRMIMEPNGNVGLSQKLSIGSTSDHPHLLTVGNVTPKQPLVATAQVGVYNNGPSFVITREAVNNVEGIFGSDNSATVFGSVSNHPVFFRTGNLNRMTINTAGDIGVGTTSPTSKLHVAGAVNFTGLRTQEHATSPNVIGGFSGNTVPAGIHGATIGGGGLAGFVNQVSSDFTTVGGGANNNAAGGFSTVGGGRDNSASGLDSAVGGGRANSAAGQSATVPGGLSNTAAGSFSFAAGRRAKANHQGAFVWADSTDADFASTANNQFLIRAAGGVRINTTAPATPLHVEGGHIHLGTPGTGILFKSPNGVCGVLRMDNAGTLQFTGGIACP